MHRAIDSRDQSLIKYLFDNGGTINNHGSDEICILAKAAGTDVQTVQFLFENGAVLCKPGNRCEPNALSEAARKGNIDILQLLLSYAHDEIVSESTEALTVAAFAGHVESVKILLRAGMDLESRDQYNRTALHVACLPYHTTLPDMVEFLISQGARVDARDFRSDTPCMFKIENHYFKLEHFQHSLDVVHIHRDAYRQDPAVTKHLLEAGSYITARNINGNTPILMLAAKMHCPNNTHARAPHTIKSSSIEVLKMILAAGSDVVLQNNKGHTALHCFVLSRLICSTGECAVEAATLLFQGGVDVKAVDASGRTVLDILRGKISTSRQHRLLLATITDFLQERSRPRITVSNDDM